MGCAGWSLHRDTAAFFPAEGTHLQRYASLFGAVEINSSFYRPHQPKTYARWADSVPAGFRFSVKMPRAITHDQKLKNIELQLAQFAEEAGELGNKLGCVLLQLPPSQKFEAVIANDFMARARDTFSCMIACEARHPSWFTDEVSKLLERHAITRVIADPPKGQLGAHVPTTDAIYLRLHGSPRIYYSSYPEDYLIRLAEELAEHAQLGRTAWLIFDNTASGAAQMNALTVITAQTYSD